MNTVDVSEEIKITDESLRRFIAYINTYIEKEQPSQYRNQTTINDIIYFFGISVDERKYQAAQGYDLFKEHVINVLVE